MDTQITLDEYKTVLEQTILEFVDLALEIQELTPGRTKEIITFSRENLENAESIEDFYYITEEIKDRFPELKHQIEAELKTFEEHRKYKIA